MCDFIRPIKPIKLCCIYQNPVSLIFISFVLIKYERKSRTQGGL